MNLLSFLRPRLERGGSVSNLEVDIKAAEAVAA
jgi:hypothetical protein